MSGTSDGRDPGGGSDSQLVLIACLLRAEGSTGVQTHFQELRRYLEEADATVEIVTPYSWSRLPTYPVFGLRVILKRCSATASVLWYRHWHEAFLRNALRRRLARTGDCVVYAQGPLEAKAALSARRGSNQRVILAIHYRISQADEWCNPVSGAIKRDGLAFRRIRRAERETLQRVDGIVYVSHWARQAVLSWLPEAAQVSSAIISNFTAPFPVESRPGPLRDLVNTGRLDHIKNQRFLLDMLAAAKRTGRTLTLDVFGDGPLLGELQDRVRSLGLEGQVRFLGYRQDIRAFMSGYRLYAHSSYSETSSLAIMEAMCAGLPILAAPVGGLPELLDDGVEGRFWNLDDPAGAAAIACGLLDDETQRTAAAKAARDRFRCQFDANAVVPRLLSFLRGTHPPDADWLATPGVLPTRPFAIDKRFR